jgi:simple sugar transport system ATP-binding protein
MEGVTHETGRHLPPGTPPLVFLKGIGKVFPGVVANDGVDLDVYPGEIHALLGENGAGKSTLMNILTGIYRPDAGEIIIDGYTVNFASPLDAIASGIGMVHQHFKLVRAFTVAENIHLGWKETPFRASSAELEARTSIRALASSISPRANSSASKSSAFWRAPRASSSSMSQPRC